MTLINAWWTRDGAGGDKAERGALVSCDGCLPPALRRGTVAELSAFDWELGDLEAGPHLCPSCAHLPRAPYPRRKGSPEARPALPNFLIIGAGKCGTTSLHRYLAVHPEIHMATAKEVRFFQDPACLERLDTYATFFDRSKAIRGEASPVYSVDPIAPGVPKRIRAAIPDVKLLYLVRDPIQRVISAHRQQLVAQRRAGTQLSSLQEALEDLEDPHHRYVVPSRYATQLERYLEFFRREQLLVVDQAELLSRRRETLRRIFQFLGIDEGFWSPLYEDVHHTHESKVDIGWTSTGRWLTQSRSAKAVWRLIPTAPREALRRPMRRAAARRVAATSRELENLNEGLRERLRGVFREEVERLRALTGSEFASWQI